MTLDPDPLDVGVTAAEDGYEVTVTARSFARDVSLLVDRVAADATVDDALITLPAGRSATFRVRTRVPGLEKDLSDAPVLRTANDLRRG
jgi:beta-mannosidase